jgi:glycosyltransferase involved in cell wall biosynthesis
VDDLRPGVTAVIPAIPPRERLLLRALASVAAQTRPVDAVSVAVDHGRAGAAATRNRALEAVGTEWAAFLDDDDEWLPRHVATLLDAAGATGAHVVYPWFEVPRGWDPFPGVEGRPFDAGELASTRNYVPVTVLARTAMLRDVGGFEAIGPAHDACDDWGLWRKLLAAGAVFHHVDARTWTRHRHGRNTSGRPQAWDYGDDYSEAALEEVRRGRRIRLCGPGCAGGHTHDPFTCRAPGPQRPRVPAKGSEGDPMTRSPRPPRPPRPPR